MSVEQAFALDADVYERQLPGPKSTALQLPPRADKSDIGCRWEFEVDRDAPAETT